VWARPARRAIIHGVVGPRGSKDLGYGVIGSPTDSGSVSLGSSPGTPADRDEHPMRERYHSLWIWPPFARSGNVTVRWSGFLPQEPSREARPRCVGASPAGPSRR